MQSNVLTYCLLKFPFYHHAVASSLYAHEISILPAGYVELGKHLIPKLSVTAARAPSKRNYHCF